MRVCESLVLYICSAQPGCTELELFSRRDKCVLADIETHRDERRRNDVLAICVLPRRSRTRRSRTGVVAELKVLHYVVAGCGCCVRRLIRHPVSYRRVADSCMVRTWLEVVQRDCQVRGLSKDDAMVRGRWRKDDKDG